MCSFSPNQGVADADYSFLEYDAALTGNFLLNFPMCLLFPSS